MNLVKKNIINFPYLSRAKTYLHKSTCNSMPLLSALIIAITKAIIISKTINENISIENFYNLLSQDFLFLLLILVLNLLSAVIFRNFFWLLTITLNTLYLVDSYLLLTLDHHLTVTAVKALYKDIFKIEGVLPSKILLFAPFLLFTFLKFRFLNLRLNKFIYLSLLFLIPVTFSHQDRSLLKYKFPPEYKKYKINNTQKSFYDKQTAKQARVKFNKNFKLEIPDSKPNIITIVIESYSASYSKKTSGIEDLTPKIDKLSEQGTLFRNFYANYEISEGALVAILNAVPPLPFPGNRFRMMKSFATQLSIIKPLKKLNYETTALFGLDTSFANTDIYLKSLNFDKTLDKNDFILQENLPKQALGSVPDKMLFERVINDYDRFKKPFFTFIATTSTHKPWTHPEGLGNNRADVMKYLDNAVFDFYLKLKKKNFFDNGILIITADHKSPDLISNKEIELFGDSAHARIPLIIIGKGVAKNKIDNRTYQQADLFRKLNSAINTENELSKNVITVSSYTKNLWDDKRIGHFSIIKDNKAFQGMVYGTNIRWLDNIPTNKDELEKKIHLQRAAHQKKIKTECTNKLNLTPDLSTNGIRYKDSSKQFISKNPHNLTTANNFELAGFIKITKPGYYFFEFPKHIDGCLAIGEQTIIDQRNRKSYFNPEVTYLEAGLHQLNANIRNTNNKKFELYWKSRTEGDLTLLPLSALIAPLGAYRIEKEQNSNTLDNIFIHSGGPKNYAPENTSLLIDEAKRLGYNNIHLRATLNENKLFIGNSKIEPGQNFVEKILKIDSEVQKQLPSDKWLNQILSQKPQLLIEILKKYSINTNFLIEVDQQENSEQILANTLHDTLEPFIEKIWIQSSNINLLKQIHSKNNNYRLILQAEQLPTALEPAIRAIALNKKNLSAPNSFTIFAYNINSKHDLSFNKKLANFFVIDSDIQVNGKLETSEFFNSKSENIKIYDSLSKVEPAIVGNKNFSKLIGKNAVYFVKK